MPLIIPDGLPAVGTLKEENIFTMRSARAISQDIRPLKIVIVNLMPTKIATETQLARMLANSPLQVELSLLSMETHAATHISQEHMEAFYKTLDEVKHEKFDGMILTGAPVEQMPFEEVDYWQELTEILDWAEDSVHSSFFLCWGAQAALYYYYGIDKRPLPEKLFGIFPEQVVRPHNPLVRGFDETFYAPHSRHTETPREEILKHPEIRILAECPETGPHIMSTEEGRQIFVTGHQEYDKDTLEKEYLRDLQAGKPISVPQNYYREDDPEQEILFTWRAHGSLLYGNWLNYYVYQTTPYDVQRIEKGAARDFDEDLGDEE